MSPSAPNNRHRWITALAVAIFVGYALNFLYFFVDDEGIPYVYAQNLLNGRGLVYNSLEGRAEGYSDLLHVLQSTGILAIVHTFSLPKFSVFFVGKALSFGAGILIVVLVLSILRRLRVGPFESAAGAAFLILTGPLAAWSCSSLETVPTTLGVVVLIWALLGERDRPALLAAVFLLLERIDGVIHAGVVLGAMVFMASPVRRRRLLRSVVLPFTVMFFAYHGARYAYFGDWLPLPLRAKVLYKLMPDPRVVEIRPNESYLLQFVRTIGWPAALGVLAASLSMLRRRGPVAPIAMACLALAAYASLVGDWMFGSRFFVPVLPMAAIVTASALSLLSQWSWRLAVLATATSIAWSAFSGVAFLRSYTEVRRTESFLARPSWEAKAFFGHFYEIYSRTKTYISPGTVVADNQAGFLPFMLQVDNIDDLGICSPFYARLPTTDLVLTEVGKYQPLRPGRPRRAGEAYLLYHEATFMVVRRDLLRSANRGREPSHLLGGHYELMDKDDVGGNLVYRRTALSAEPFQTTPDAFLENLAHASYVQAATIDGRSILPARAKLDLPWLRDRAGSLKVERATRIGVQFAANDEPVYHFSVEELIADDAATAQLWVKSIDGRTVYQTRVALEPRAPRSIWADFPAGSEAAYLEILLSADSSRSVTARLTDLRVLGQRAELRAFVVGRLTFPKHR